MSHSTHKRKATPEWKAAVKKYSKPKIKSSIRQLFDTVGVYALLWILMGWLAQNHLWIALLITPLAGLMTVRVFIIFHDCGHYNYFKSKRACKVVGYLTGILTFTPFHDWGKDHKLHHATCGNLDKRGFGDIWTITVEEFKKASPVERLKYRIYRNPFIIFIIGPVFVFTIKQRFSRTHTGSAGKASVWWTNIGLLVFFGLMYWLIGWQFFLLQFAVISVGAIAGVWMFYVQHQFEDTYWENDEDWSFVESALEGSSFYKLPKILQWFTGNIGFHHIHHLSSKIPNYSLESAYYDSEIFQEIEPLTVKRSLKLIGFRLWDEKNRCMVGYSSLKEKSA